LIDENVVFRKRDIAVDGLAGFTSHAPDELGGPASLPGLNVAALEFVVPETGSIVAGLPDVGDSASGCGASGHFRRKRSIVAMPADTITAP
jgi:hypothetical protein